MNATGDECIILGRINGVHGVRGWVKVYSETQPRENILSYRQWLVGKPGNWRTVVVVDGRRQGKNVVAQLEGCNDRDVAATFHGEQIAIRREQLPAPSADEFYWADLVGLTVKNREGVTLGKVDHLLETGANDVLVVHDDDGSERLIPFVQGPFVLEVDLQAGELLVDWDPDF